MRLGLLFAIVLTMLLAGCAAQESVSTADSEAKSSECKTDADCCSTVTRSSLLKRNSAQEESK